MKTAGYSLMLVTMLTVLVGAAAGDCTSSPELNVNQTVCVSADTAGDCTAEGGGSGAPKVGGVTVPVSDDENAPVDSECTPGGDCRDPAKLCVVGLCQPQALQSLNVCGTNEASFAIKVAIDGLAGNNVPNNFIADYVDEGSCYIDYQCYGQNVRNPSNNCEVCNPATDTGKTKWTLLDPGQTCEKPNGAGTGECVSGPNNSRICQ